MSQSVCTAGMGMMPIAETAASKPYPKMDTPTAHAVLKSV